MARVDVYLGVIPKNLKITKLYPPERDAELLGACDKVQKEKVFSWQLLECALKRSFNVDLNALYPTRKPNGKWEIKDYNFSISHSNGAVVVAVSNAPIGVDLERLDRDVSAILKTLTEKELIEYEKSSDKEYSLIKKWTEKESLYKRVGEGAFNPFKTETTGEHFITKQIEVNGEVFVLTVSCEERTKLNFVKNGK